MQTNDSTPYITFEHLFITRSLYANAYFIARSTASPINLPFVRAGICMSLAILTASVLPLYLTLFSSFIIPMVGICFFILLTIFFMFILPCVVKGQGAKIFDSNKLIELPFTISLFKSFFEISNEKETIRQYWTEVDRSLETSDMFVILGGKQRPLLLIEKQQLTNEQQNSLSSFLQKMLAYKHKKIT